MMRQLAVVGLTVAFALLFTTPPASADAYSFGLIPGNGSVAGPPGSTVGWGYSITNLNPIGGDWLVTTSVSAGLFLNGTPNASVFDFPVVAPATTITVPFSPVVTAACPSPPCGLYGLTWNAGAPVGFTNTGNFVLGAEFWTGDPLAGGTFVAAAPSATQPYSATVVPEPLSCLLLVTGLGALWLRRKGNVIPRQTP